MRNLKGSITTLAAVGLTALATTAGAPAPERFIVDCDRFGYIGQVSVYNTFSDAQAGKNARHVAIIMPQRGGSIYMSRAMGGEFNEFNAFLTNWSDNDDPEHPGRGNPYNKNEGFIQMYDDDADKWQNQEAYWSKDLHTFTFKSKGRNANYPSTADPGDYARLWNAGAPQGAGESTKGSFWRYEISFTATGLNGQDLDDDGFFESHNNATGYSGFFKGVFRNESERYPESNGYYVVHLTFNNINAVAVFAENDHFGSSTVKKK